jgi:hypothetical protein
MKINDCMVKVQLKVFHGVNNVQESVLGMMLPILADIMQFHNRTQKLGNNLLAIC